MGQETRKATDVLLELESKVGILLDIVRAQDLNIKVLSNKLNDVMSQLKRQQAGPPRITVETVQTAVAPPMPAGFTQMPPGDPERNIPIQADLRLPQTGSPQGFRRTSRPETFVGQKVIEGDSAYLNRPGMDEVRMPVQMPQMPPGRQAPTAPPQMPQGRQAPPGRAEAMAREPQDSQQMEPGLPPMDELAPPMVQGQIPTMQRIVDKNGKSIFLADVEITDLSTSQLIFKTRTNGTGKWMASLGIGAYRVVISKRASSTANKEKLEATQDIQVDGSKKPLELPMLIIK
jgi:hypothetical protein